MDPDKALAELRELATSSDRHSEARSERFAEVFDGLDTWITNGGFLPKDWDGMLIGAGLHDPKPTLASRDASQDMPCVYCRTPLWKIHPDAPHELAWGHVRREDALHCAPSRKPGVWPVPS